MAAIRRAGIVLALLLAACDRPRLALGRDRLHRVRHVFVIVLENHGLDASFGSRHAPYLTDSLVPRGLLLRQYYAIAHNSLANYIAMVSGMAPTPETQGDCPIYQDFVQTGVAADGQPIGRGCIYPAHVPSIATQLDAARLEWKGYMEDMGNDPNRESATCGHPAVGKPDHTATATRVDQYMTRHDPFMYFHAIIDSAACARHVVRLATLPSDLATADSTPNFSLIIPNSCHDAHDVPCANGERGDIEAADAFLGHWVPIIMSSAAFRRDGLLVITFDEANTGDASACCGEVSGPNTRAAGGGGPGGGRIGALLLSPFATPGSVSDEPFNHYSLLRSVEDAFGLSKLGYAARRGVASFAVR